MVPLDIELLSRAAPVNVAEYLREQITTLSEAPVAQSLLHLVALEAVPPDVVRIWLSITKDAHSLSAALQQNSSNLARTSAIQRFGAWFRSKHWRAAWEALGGAPGIAQLFAQLSVSQVNKFTRILGRSVRGKAGQAKTEKRDVVTQLLLLLVPQLETGNDTSPTQHLKAADADNRELAHLYSALLPACTSQMVHKVLFGPQMVMTLSGDQRHLLREHLNVFVQDAAPTLPSKSRWPDQEKHLPALILAVMHNAQVDDPAKLVCFLTDAFESIFSKESARISSPTPVASLCQKLVQRRGLEPSLRMHMFQVILRILSKHTERVGPFAARLHKQALRSWSRAADMFEHILLELFHVSPSHQRQHLFCKLYKHVPPRQRWALLKLMVCPDQHASTNDLDEEQVVQQLLSCRHHLISLRVGVLLALPTPQALRLMGHLAARRLRDRVITVGRADSILGFTTAHGYLNFDMVRFELQRDLVTQERISVATAAVQDVRARVSRSSDAGVREDLARSGLHWAICSRSIELYTSTIVWMRRFVRDVTVARSLFSEGSLHKREAIQLLSGIPEVLDQHVTAVHIRDRIHDANNAIWEWFETVRKSLLEPSFSVQNTAGARLLVRPVVVERMRRIDQLQTHLGLDTNAISELVWDETVDLLIRIEKACMEPDYRRLAMYHIAGPLGTELEPSFFATDALRIRSMAGLSFVEKLFVARDALWKQHRISLNPAVARLPRGIPQGLPLHVAPSIWNLDYILARTPNCFLLNKAREVVFADSHIALQPVAQDDATRDAVKDCHQDYLFSLLLLTKAHRSKIGKRQTLEQAFVHAVGVLSHNRMTRQEAEAELRDHAFTVLVQCHKVPRFPSLYAPSRFPQLPTTQVDDRNSSIRIEWDPNKLGSPPMFAERQLETTVFDEMLSCSASLNLHDGTLCYYTSEFGGYSFRTTPYVVRARHQVSAADVALAGCRNGDHPKDKIRCIREAQIVWHLMLFDELCVRPKSDTSAITLPFPDKAHVRYPNMVLSRSFVNAMRAKMDDNSAMHHMLKHLGFQIPVSLLREFTQRLTTARREGRLSKGDQLATQFVRCLMASDRPSAALPFVLRAILDNSQDSSWHRVLLSQRFLRQLPAQDTCKAVTHLAAEILQRTASDTKSGISVSTVKMLAQILGQADVIPASVAIETLAKLLDQTDHVDVRFAALSSMLELICSRPSTHDAAAERLVPELDRFVRILAAIDETRPSESEESWKDGVLPSVYESSIMPSSDLGSMKKLPRTFQLVSETMQKSALWAPILMQRVMLPAMKRSIEVHGRWLDTFLQRHSLSVETLALPVPPTKLEMLNTLVTRHAALTPDWIVELYCKMLLFNVRPVAQVKQLRAQLKHTDHNAEKHWLAITEKPETKSIGSPPFLAEFVYGVAESAQDKNAIRQVLLARQYAICKAQEVLEAMLDDMLDSAWIDEQSFDCIMAQLRYENHGQRRTRWARDVAWELCLRPILEKVIAKVDSRRTTAWQRDPERKPRLLPDMFLYRLELLPYPQVGESSLTPDEKLNKCQTFSRAVIEQVTHLVGRATPYQDELERLQGAVTDCPVHLQAAVALALGKLDTGDLTECLCIAMAIELLQTASCTECEIAAIQSMLDEWSRSEVEWIRVQLDGLVGARSGRTIKDAKLERALRQSEVGVDQADSDRDDRSDLGGSLDSWRPLSGASNVGVQYVMQNM